MRSASYCIRCCALFTGRVLEFHRAQQLPSGKYPSSMRHQSVFFFLEFPPSFKPILSYPIPPSCLGGPICAGGPPAVCSVQGRAFRTKRVCVSPRLAASLLEPHGCLGLKTYASVPRVRETRPDRARQVFRPFAPGVGFFLCTTGMVRRGREEDEGHNGLLVCVRVRVRVGARRLAAFRVHR